ncbi:MAG TPA: pyruvate kinase [Roseiflexaceae bacterium]|nr:pyruvate kinase [Roseiflexaceae bacterium]
MRRTKIVVTIGPASRSAEMIAKLLEAGMDVARLNFSHGSHAEHLANIATLREVAARMGKPLALLQDLQGPKIRTGTLEGGQPVLLVPGQPLRISIDGVVGTASHISTTYQELPQDVNPGDRILISDGLIELHVVSKTVTDIDTEVVYGGELREHQGINLPGVNVSAPALTPKDAEDLEFGLAHDVDYVALSFVRRASDIDDIKHRIAAAGKRTPVIAKIEKPEALADLTAILQKVDGVMVARGDLGVEMSPEQVPVVQKQLIEAANEVGIPVITATQMLESMIRNPRPTRAEASDVANAIIDGTDAVMLSGETATGAFPVGAVQMMAKIAEAAEASGRHGDHSASTPWQVARQPDLATAMSSAACAIVRILPVRGIVAFTQSGRTAQLVSRERPEVPIYAFTPDEQVYRRLALVWGVVPMMMEYVDRLSDLTVRVTQRLLEIQAVQPGDTFVLTGGHPIAVRGMTNFVKVIQL